MGKSSIEWCTDVWNPVRGCSRVSPGCVNCYAERIAARFSDPGKPFEGFAERGKPGAHWMHRVELIPGKLEEPLHWKTPRRVFVNSMSDLFHESLAVESIDRIMGVIAQCPRHTFQVLTKRAEKMQAYSGGMAALSASERGDRIVRAMYRGHPAEGLVRQSLAEAPNSGGGFDWPLPNLWLGVSCEDQQRADERIPLLLQTPAAVRFVSLEPLLGPIDLETIGKAGRGDDINALTGWRTSYGYKPRSRDECATEVSQRRDRPHLDWAIIGGESGPTPRPCSIEHVRSIVRQCDTAQVKCFVKQVGSRPVMRTDEWLEWCDREGWAPEDAEEAGPRHVVIPMRDRKGGTPSEWPEDLRIRQFPERTQ